MDDALLIFQPPTQAQIEEDFKDDLVLVRKEKMRIAHVRRKLMEKRHKGKNKVGWEKGKPRKTLLGRMTNFLKD